MNNVQNPLQGKLEIDSAGKTLTKCQKCRILCGYESVLVTLLVLAIGGSHTYITLAYKQTAFEASEGLWVFPLLAGLSFLLAAVILVRSCIVVFVPKKKKEEDKTSSTAFAALKARYHDIFDVNGKYFLTKMYAAEAFEHFQQVYSLTILYLCLMPVPLSLVVCAVLSIELAINIWATFHMESQEVRDRLLMLDIFTDLFCLAFPLCYTSFILGLPLLVENMLLIMVYPTISILSKLYDVWEDYFAVDLQRMEDLRKVRRRKSILGLSHNQEVLETQLKHYPNWLRYSFTVLNVVFLLFFVVLGIVQLSTRPSRETCLAKFTNEVWRGCTVELPFCQNPFVARCDCGVLQLTNYSQREFPNSFGQLSSLVRLGVYEGALEALSKDFGDRHAKLIMVEVFGTRLTALPDSFGNLNNLVILGVFNNRLTALPDSFGNLNNLINLDIFNNRLTALPDSIGNLNNLLRLSVSNNRLTELPDSIGYLNNLFSLVVFNNRLTALPNSIGNLNNLFILRVFNNRLTALPDSIGNLNNLQYLYAWNNTFNSLPERLGSINSLVDVDVRHNQLKAVPSFSSDNLEYLGLEGNPLCENGNLPNLNGVEGMCTKQCGFDCPSVWLGKYGCDDNDYTYDIVKLYNINMSIQPKPNSGCNTAACEYDKGDCVVG
eukprot:g2554.t1